MREPTASASVWLDLARGLAACAVFFGHLRALFFLDAGAAPQLNFAFKGLYYVTGFGHQSVIVFFVLSGYLVGGTALRAMREGCFSWAQYVSRRATRLYVVLGPALLLTLVLDIAGVRLFGSSGTFYGGELRGAALERVDFSQSLSPLTLVGNLSFLQTIFVPTFGTNGPLWSLAHEALYYALCPLLLGTFYVTGTLSRARHAAVVLAVLAFLPARFGLGFLVWLLGLGVAWLEQNGSFRSPRYSRTLALLAFLGCLHISRIGALGIADDLVVGTSFAFLLTTLVAQKAPLERAPTSSALGTCAALLSASSYTLYVTHFPLLVFLAEANLERERLAMSSASLLLAGGVGATTFALAFLLSRLTEYKTETFRRWLQRRLQPVVPE